MLLVPIGIVITLAAMSLGLFSHDAGLWGLDHWSYFPAALRILLLGVCIVAMVRPAREPAGRWFARRVDGLLDPASSYMPRLVATAAFFVVCVVFRSATQLLGDGELMAKIAENSTAPGRSLAEGVHYAVLNDPLAPGTAAIHAVVAHAGLWAGVSVRTALSGFYALVGAGWMLVVFAGVARAGLPQSARRLLAVLFVTSGAIMLFFGYIEDYGLLLVIATYLALFGLRESSGKISLATALVLALVAVVLHILAALVLPAALYIAATRLPAGRRRPPVVGAVVVVITVVAAAALPLIRGLSGYYRPLASGPHAILSAHYAASMVNLLFILFPLLPVLIVAALSRPGAGAAMPRWVRHFCWVGVAPFVVFLLFFKPGLGVARDWDLYAMAAPFLVVALAPLLASARERLEPWVFSIFVVGIVQTGGWIAVNASEGRSLARYESTLRHDAPDGGYGYEVLANYHDRRGLHAEACNDWRAALAAEGNPRYAFNAGMCAAKEGDTDEAIELMQRGLRSAPANTDARVALAGLLADRGDFEALIATVRDGLQYEPDNPSYNVFLGMALLQTRQLEAARVQLTRCLDLDLTPPMRAQVTRALQALDATGQ